MYAKLVLRANTVFSANDFQTTLINVITGSTTNVSTLSTAWDSSLSSIVTTVAPGWSVWDSNAGTAFGNATPQVIRAVVSDDPTKYKYVWVNSSQLDSSTNGPHLNWIHGEGWNANTNVGTNMLTTIPTATSATKYWYSMPAQHTIATLTTTPLVVYISASANHLFLYSSSIAPVTTTTWNSYIFLSEYTRDDPWNTVSNGYNNWFMIGNAYPGNSTTLQNGSIPNLPTNNSSVPPVTNVSHLAAWAGASEASANFAIGNRYIKRNGISYGNIAFAKFNTTDSFNYGYYTRKSDLSPAITLSEIFLYQGDNMPPSYGLHNFGSISAKAPYIYPTFGTLGSSQDEIVIDGVTYTLLNAGLYASLILVKQV